MRRWILILSMLWTKGAVLLLYTALLYSEIEIAYFYLGLSFCVLQVLDAEMKEGTRL